MSFGAASSVLMWPCLASTPWEVHKPRVSRWLILTRSARQATQLHGVDCTSTSSTSRRLYDSRHHAAPDQSLQLSDADSCKPTLHASDEVAGQAAERAPQATIARLARLVFSWPSGTKFLLHNECTTFIGRVGKARNLLHNECATGAHRLSMSKMRSSFWRSRSVAGSEKCSVTGSLSMAPSSASCSNALAS